MLLAYNMTYSAMPDLSLKAVALLFQVKWNSRSSRPASFLVKETLASFVSNLEEDDVGFLYEPEKQPEICIHPGQLVGKILNSRFPYHFQFSKGVEVFASLLNSLDDDYKKMGLIVTDCFDKSDADAVGGMLSGIKDASVYVFGVGRHCDPSLEAICKEVEVNYVKLEDVEELDASLKVVRNREQAE